MEMHHGPFRRRAATAKDLENGSKTQTTEAPPSLFTFAKELPMSDSQSDSSLSQPRKKSRRRLLKAAFSLAGVVAIAEIAFDDAESARRGYGGPVFFPSDTPTPSNTPTDTPTNTPTNTPTDTPTNTPTDTPTNTPTNTPTDTPTNTPTNTPTDTPTNTPTDTPI